MDIAVKPYSLTKILKYCWCLCFIHFNMYSVAIMTKIVQPLYESLIPLKQGEIETMTSPGLKGTLIDS